MRKLPCLLLGGLDVTTEFFGSLDLSQKQASPLVVVVVVVHLTLMLRVNVVLGREEWAAAGTMSRESAESKKQVW